MQFQPLSCIIKVQGKASALELEIQATCKTIKPKGKLYFRINYSYQSSAFWSTGNRMIDGNGIFLFWNREFLANIQSILLIWRSGNFFDAKNTISRPSKNVKVIRQNSTVINVIKTTYLKILYFGPQQCIQSFSCF